jgi:coenzyme F420-dependent glucose-6-phosphate dehydrogenase
MPDDPVRLGWWLSSEEHDPRRLVDHARLAESTGFRTAMVSDHLQPWTRGQGHASFVWTVLGAIAHATDELEVGTGVTAMLHRNHPVAVAQAAATAGLMFEGRFFLGVGSGERLNEQPFGERWPRAGERRERMCEAVGLLRRLWSGDDTSARGATWNVENLALFSLPAPPPPVYVAASGTLSAKVAGEIGDGMIGVAPDARLVDVFHGSGGAGKRCLAQLHISLAASMDAAMDQAWEWWPNGAVPPSLLSELAQPEDFEAAAADVQRDVMSRTVVCTTDAATVIGAIDRFVGAGFDTVYLHQVGPHQQRLADMAASELIPHYAT